MGCCSITWVTLVYFPLKGDYVACTTSFVEPLEQQISGGVAKPTHFSLTLNDFFPYSVCIWFFISLIF